MYFGVRLGPNQLVGWLSKYGDFETVMKQKIVKKLPNATVEEVVADCRKFMKSICDLEDYYGEMRDAAYFFEDKYGAKLHTLFDSTVKHFLKRYTPQYDDHCGVHATDYEFLYVYGYNYYDAYIVCDMTIEDLIERRKELMENQPLPFTPKQYVLVFTDPADY
jgi:hypothetical protein